MSGNIQNKLRQTRKPRVHITLDVQAEGRPQKELPFVIGVLGDFGGHDDVTFDVKLKTKDGEPDLDQDGRQKKKKVTRKLPAFTERGFITIDRDNFNAVMERMTPALKLRVDNKLSDDGKQIPVNLAFSSLEDFEPAKVAAQVPQLEALLEKRAKLRDLLAKADRSEKLEELLEQILKDGNDRKQVAQDLGLGPAKE